MSDIQHEKRNLPASLSAGLVVGLLQVFLALSFAALIFSGELSFAISPGIGLVLVGTILNGAIIALFTSLPGAVGGSQDVPAAITAVTVAAIAAALRGVATQEQLFLTAVAAISVTTLLSGVFFWMLGTFRLGGLVRFLPYPVVGGFLAGTGWLLVQGAVGMMVNLPAAAPARQIWQAPDLWHWLPGALAALFILLALRRSDHVLLLPGFLVGMLLLFFTAAALSGMSLADLSAAGWLLGPFENDAAWRFFAPQAIRGADWLAVWNQAGDIIAILLVSAVSLLLNTGGLELVTGQDLEIDHDLRFTGLANIAGGLAGGPVGYSQLSLSTLNFNMGAKSRLPGLIGVAVCVIVLLAGGSVLAYFPRLVIGALLLYLGFSFLSEWVIEGFFKLPKIDYAIVLVILLVTMTVGFLEAVGLGLLLAVIMFVISYSRVNVVRHELDGRTYQSRFSRSRGQNQALQEAGESLYILQLQGFIFFGTANNLLQQLRRRISDPERPAPDYVVLDFHRVAGLDSTGLLSFRRMIQLAQDAGLTLIFTAASGRVRDQLTQGELLDNGRDLRFFPTLDQGVEWCESHILSQAGITDETRDLPLPAQLQLILPETVDLVGLLDYCERLDVPAGTCFITLGSAADDLFFVESGQVTSQIARPGAAPLRLETSGSGGVVGELAFYLEQQRTADVITDTPSTLYRLTRASLQRMEKENPELAADLHKLMVHLLAERVVKITGSMRALER